MAYASAWADPDRYVRYWPGPEMGRSHRRNPARRRRIDCAGGEALAWRESDCCDDTYRDSRGPQRESGRLDGKGQRRRLPRPKHIIVKCAVDDKPGRFSMREPLGNNTREGQRALTVGHTRYVNLNALPDVLAPCPVSLAC